MSFKLKLQTTSLMAVVMCGLYPISVHAELIRTDVDAGSYVVVDDLNGVMWADVLQYTNSTFSQMSSEIENLNTSNFAGASDWHLATIDEVRQLFDQIITVGDARQFNTTNTDGGYSQWVTGIYDQVNTPGTHAGATWRYTLADPDNSLTFQERSMDGLNFYNDHPYLTVGAFVVAHNPMQVPEPGIFPLFIVGLVGLLGIRGKKAPKRL